MSQLRSFPGDPKLTLVAYGQSRSVINYLIDNFGETGMNVLLTNISKGKTIDEALINAYGFDLDTLDSDWRKSIGAGPYELREESVVEVNDISSGSCRSNNLIFALPLLLLYSVKNIKRFF